MIPWLDSDTPFPPVDSALTEEDGAAGLLAAGADLSPQRLLDAYRQGIFPWFSDGQPILWWSTNPRMVLMVDRFKISKSLKKSLRKLQNNPDIEFKFDSAFEMVMRACAEPRMDEDGNAGGTWITEPMVAAYTELHQLGIAHSTEMWMDGELVGGAYGICLGRMFYGESMFSRVRDGSKLAFAHLVHFLKSQQVRMIDCQQQTRHLASLGAAPVSRSEFIRHISQTTGMAPITEWRIIGAGV